MSGLMSANSAQSTPMRPAELLLQRPHRALAAAEGPLVFMTTGRSCRRSTR
jgi:hypothetical protein